MNHISNLQQITLSGIDAQNLHQLDPQGIAQAVLSLAAVVEGIAASAFYTLKFAGSVLALGTLKVLILISGREENILPTVSSTWVTAKRAGAQGLGAVASLTAALSSFFGGTEWNLGVQARLGNYRWERKEGEKEAKHQAAQEKFDSINTHLNSLKDFLEGSKTEVDVQGLEEIVKVCKKLLTETVPLLGEYDKLKHEADRAAKVLGQKPVLPTNLVNTGALWTEIEKVEEKHKLHIEFMQIAKFAESSPEQAKKIVESINLQTRKCREDLEKWFLIGENIEQVEVFAGIFTEAHRQLTELEAFEQGYEILASDAKEASKKAGLKEPMLDRYEKTDTDKVKEDLRSIKEKALALIVKSAGDAHEKLVVLNADMTMIAKGFEQARLQADDTKSIGGYLEKLTAAKERVEKELRVAQDRLQVETARLETINRLDFIKKDLPVDFLKQAEGSLREALQTFKAMQQEADSVGTYHAVLPLVHKLLLSLDEAIKRFELSEVPSVVGLTTHELDKAVQGKNLDATIQSIVKIARNVLVKRDQIKELQGLSDNLIELERMELEVFDQIQTFKALFEKTDAQLEGISLTMKPSFDSLEGQQEVLSLFAHEERVLIDGINKAILKVLNDIMKDAEEADKMDKVYLLSKLLDSLMAKQVGYSSEMLLHLTQLLEWIKEGAYPDLRKLRSMKKRMENIPGSAEAIISSPVLSVLKLPNDQKRLEELRATIPVLVALQEVFKGLLELREAISLRKEKEISLVARGLAQDEALREIQPFVETVHDRISALLEFCQNSGSQEEKSVIHQAMARLRADLEALQEDNKKRHKEGAWGDDSKGARIGTPKGKKTKGAPEADVSVRGVTKPTHKREPSDTESVAKLSQKITGHGSAAEAYQQATVDPRVKDLLKLFPVRPALVGMAMPFQSLRK